MEAEVSAPAPSEGITESQAAAKISELIAPKPPREPNGQFQPRVPRDLAPTEPTAREQAGLEPEPLQPVETEAAPAEAAPDADEDIEFDDGIDAEQPNAPSVDMPESWGKTAEAIWSTLPPEAQQFLRQHEAKRTQGISRQLNEVKAEQEKVSQAYQAIEQERLQLAQAASRYVSDAVKQFQAKFGDVKDVNQLAQQNPARYIEMDAAWRSVQAAQHEANHLQQQQQQEKAKELQEWRLAENQRLAEEAGLKDEASASAFEKSVMEFTGKVGIPAERVSQYRADELLIVRDAMRYRNAMAKKNAALKAPNPPPKVLKPGAPTSHASLSRQASQEQLSRNLKKTGNENDAAKLIRARVFGR